MTLTRWCKYLDGLVGVGYKSDKERQHHVDEQRDEGVQVSPTEEPHQGVFVLKLGEGGEHVVSIQQREQALCHETQALKLQRKREMTVQRAVNKSTGMWDFLENKTKEICYITAAFLPFKKNKMLHLVW